MLPFICTTKKPRVNVHFPYLISATLIVRNMAYSTLVSLTQTTDLILNTGKYSISVYARDKITSIRDFAVSMMSFLEDFPEKANCLEGKIRDVATKAEDIIEDFMCEQIQFEKQLKRSREVFSSIAGDMMEARLGESPASAAIPSSSSRHAYTGKNDLVIGLDEELMAIKGRLCGESSKLDVIPILGMGGIGKTTLARYAYDDLLTVEHFHVRSWVTISQDYSAQNILSCLRESMKLFDNQMVAHDNEFAMGEKVYKCLKGRRYLIVMDDVWSTKALDDVKHMFPDDNNGSRILLTTRLSDVATYVSDGPICQMKLLNEDQCWDLIKQKTFTNRNDHGCPSELEDVGKEIARSCKGLPLAVVLVAGVLSKVVETRSMWEEIAKNVNSVVGGQLEQILSLSYTNLPHDLRSCFLYMAGFPEDHEVRVSELIKLWVAEGFLNRTNDSKSFEEEAEECLENLVERSLVLVSSKKSSGKIKSCSLHDLVRDMCKRKAREERFLIHVADKCAEVCRLSITNSDKVNDICGSNFRTVLFFCSIWFEPSEMLDFFRRCKLLRVLDMPYDRGSDPPSHIFELVHLRYLALRTLVQFPSTISKLENLHTLIIKQKDKQSKGKFQLDIWRMPQLQHLVVYSLSILHVPSDGSALPLAKLQTLLEVKCLVCSEEFLKMLPMVKKVGLIYNQRDDEGTDYQLHNLTHLDQLEKLKVTMRNSSLVGQNPEFPTTLKKLTLSGMRLPWKDMSIVGSLPNLEILKLINHNCEGDTWETVDGEFPQLKFLLIEKSALCDWITECGHFPRLKCLILRLCLCLGEIPESIGEIPSLEMIEVDSSKESLVQSAREIQEDQLSYGNEALQVHIVNGLYESSLAEKASGKKRHMIGARELEIAWSDTPRYWTWKPCADSRFSEVVELKNVCRLEIKVKIKTQILSSNTTYAAYLVFRLAEGCYRLESANAVVKFVNDEDGCDDKEISVLVHLQKQVNGPQEQNGRHPVWRDDGWMEVEMGSFFNDDDDDDDDGEAEVEARLNGIGGYGKYGLIVEGIEFRPKTQLEPADGSTLPLENLQTLSEVKGPVCGEEFLKMFQNVKRLRLVYNQNHSRHQDYQLYNLTHLYQLEKLKLTMRDFFWAGRNPVFPKTLKKLTLSGGRFPWKDMTIIGSLPNLEALKLISHACHGDTWKTSDGEFPQLKFLLIEKSTLFNWITDCSHFPRLKCLILRICPSLSKIPDGIVQIPSLEMIEVDYLNKFLVKSARAIQEDLQRNSNDALQVRIISCHHESFFVEKSSGKKCYMIGARELQIAHVEFPEHWQWRSCADSRFSEVVELIDVSWLFIRVIIKTLMLCPNTIYAAYLVYKLTEECYGLESAKAFIQLFNTEDAEETSNIVHLQQRADDGIERPKVLRDDGWIEVEMGSFYNDGVDDDGEAWVALTSVDANEKRHGLIIEGIEFRPKTIFDP